MRRKKKKKMPAGTYWDDNLNRYVEPGDPKYDASRFRRMVNGAVAVKMAQEERQR